MTLTVFQLAVVIVLSMIQGMLILDWLRDKSTLKAAISRPSKQKRV